MRKGDVTEQEIEAALDLSAQRKFSASLSLFQEMLTRTRDDQARMKVLLGIVTCSTWLNLNTIREDAIQELKQFPDSDVFDAFIVMAQAKAFIDSGRAGEALDLINRILNSELLEREDLQDWRYEHLFLRGRSLTYLGRCEEALCALDAAHTASVDGKHETDMLIDRSNCLLALSRYDEAYEAASLVLPRGDEEMATLAMQYMAECRMWQSRVPEALEIYAAIEKRLPCRLVQEERIQTGIMNAMAYLEKQSPRKTTIQ